MLSKEEKRQRRIEREHQKLKALTIGSVFNKHPSGLACLFQRLVRLASADENGNCVCYTCGTKDDFRNMNGSHFVGRNNKATILEPDNIRVCCVKCNQHMSGNMGVYRKRLIEEIGEDRVLELESTRLAKSHVWSRYALAEIKINLQDEISFHEKRLGIR